MSENLAIISSKAVERVQAGHLWIYRSDVQQCNASSGAIVSLKDNKGRHFGKAFFSSSSLISLRLLTTEDIPIERKFWANRLQQAWQLRQQVVTNSEVYRIIHGESDGFPSIIVDRYGEVLSIQTLSQGAEQIKPLLVELLLEFLSPKTIVERNDSKVRRLEDLPQTISILHGEDPGEFVCSENGLCFYFHPTSGHKTGAYLDQRENRAYARSLARGKALDCFCYAGSFAIHLAQVCDAVEGIDISDAAIQAGYRNATLNNLGNIHFETDNVFDRLKLYNRLKKSFDTIVLDPPAFAKNRSHIEAAIRGYREINLRALRLLKSGGILVTSSCSQVIDETLFLNILNQAAADAGRNVQIIQKRTQGQDHPMLLSMPETYYLKCLILRVLD